MSTSRLQGQLDHALAASKQRWLLGSSAVLAAFLPSVSMAVGSAQADTWVVVVVVAFALGAAAQPDEHTALLVIAIVAAQWLIVGDGVTSPWAMAIAGCVLVFHTVIALMAVTPHRAVVGSSVLRRWLARSATMVVPTGSVWALVVIFERREMPGNVALSVLALVVLAVAAIALRARSVPPATTGSLRAK